MQVFGCVLLAIGMLNLVMNKITGIELDLFYVFLSVVGAGLFIYGAMQNKGRTFRAKSN